MNNYEFYKTREACEKAFHEVCEKTRCEACPHSPCAKRSDTHAQCVINFMFAEHVAPKVPRRRPFDADEAKAIVGSVVTVPATPDRFGRHLLVLGTDDKREDGKTYGAPEVLIAGFYDRYDVVSWCDQEELIRKGATLDGVPWGVEVTEAKS